MKKGMIFLAVLALALSVVSVNATADDDRRERGERIEGERGVYRSNFPLFEEECSSCHLAYQPWLLPGASWERIMDGQADHFGEDLALESDTVKKLKAFLVKNSAERTTFRNEWSRKILKKLDGKAPLRITEVRYIKKEHKKLINKNVFDRESIKSFSNCAACHRRADVGDYEEDYIKIPK